MIVVVVVTYSYTDRDSEKVVESFLRVTPFHCLLMALFLAH